MPEKRKHEESSSNRDPTVTKKRANRGFKVGPDNLPDGAYKRKNQKLKQNLIDRARLYKSYAKVKAAAAATTTTEPQPPPESTLDAPPPEPANPDPHPDRQNLIDAQAENPEEPVTGGPEDGREERREPPFRRRGRQAKTVPFRKEAEQGRRRREEAEARRAARANAEEERRRKLEEREKFRRAMAKAKTAGPDGKRKLGRESTVLLEKVKRMVGAGGGGM